MHYHVIGTDHECQKASSSDSGLEHALKSAMRQYHVVLIAEEVRPDQIPITFGFNLIGKDRWLSIDIDLEHKERLGLREHRYQAMGPNLELYLVNPYIYHGEAEREKIWLERIRQRCIELNAGDSDTVIVTCGDNHVPFLCGKIIANRDLLSIDRYLPYDRGDKDTKFGPFVVYE